MTVFSLDACKDLALIVACSLLAAILVNLPSIITLARLWVES